jgi:hypothetical protein
MLPLNSQIDYSTAIRQIQPPTGLDDQLPFLDDFSDLWVKAYKLQSDRATEIHEIKHRSFRFLFDCAGSDHGDGQGRRPAGVVPRTIAAYGIANPSTASRSKDDLRLRGWMREPSGEPDGTRDKGHLVAHSLGAGIQGIEVNVFEQDRALNRGWSEDGKRFRAMEKYCAKNEGTMFFHRLIYVGETDVPAWTEFGVFRTSADLWVEVFSNGQ